MSAGKVCCVIAVGAAVFLAVFAPPKEILLLALDVALLGFGVLIG